MRYDVHFRLAHELKKHLHEIMGWDGPMTHRQFVCWNEWLDFVSINQPSRDNYYQMQVACETRRSNSKKPQNIKLDSFKLKFTKKTIDPTTQKPTLSSKPKAQTPQQKLDALKQVWINRMTKPVTVKNGDQIIEVVEPAAVKAKRLQAEQRQKARENRAASRGVPKPPLKDAQDVTSEAIKEPTDERRLSSQSGRRSVPLRRDARRSVKKDSE